MKYLSKGLGAFIVTLCLAASNYLLPCYGEDTSWVKSSNIYEIFVRSFNDSDGDGIGDLKGITNRMGDLKDLGIKTIWLTPIFTSPSDHGYDAVDYMAVDSRYGTISDLKTLVDTAHSNGIKVILDLAINHCSSKNQLFTEGKHNSWFVWSNQDLGWPGPWDNTDDFCAGATWKKDAMGRGYYYAAFDASMPDFNYNDQAARGEIVQYFSDVMGFWINKTGVDGYRCDAVRYFAESGRNYKNWTQQRDQDETHQIWQQFRQNLTVMKPGAILVAEAPTETDDQLLSYYGNGNEFNSCFHFMFQGLLVSHIKWGVRDENFFKEMYGIQGELPKDNTTCVTDSIFLSNHDSFAGDRAATQLGGNTDKIKAVASLYLTLSGIPVVYYGEEIGMQNIDNKPANGNDDAIRGKIDWSEYDRQKSDPDSTLVHYRKLINLRNSYPALSSGVSYFVHSGYRYQPDIPTPDQCAWDSDQFKGGSPVTSVIRVSGAQRILVVHNTAANNGAANNNGWTYVYVDLTQRSGLDIPYGTKITPLKSYPAQETSFPAVDKDNQAAYPLGWFGPNQTKIFYLGNDLGADYITYDNVLGKVKN